MALLTQSSRTALAVSLKAQPLHLAWGTGDPAWGSTFTRAFTFLDEQIPLPHAHLKSVSIADATNGVAIDAQTGRLTRTDSSVPDTITVTYTTGTPPEAIQASTLLHEVGRKAVGEITFCVGDENGLLVTPTGRFTATDTPTNQLYVHATFDFEDAANETIRGLGIFIGTEVADSCPPEQRYFVPSDLKNPGILLVLENTVPLIRTADPPSPGGLQAISEGHASAARRFCEGARGIACEAFSFVITL